MTEKGQSRVRVHLIVGARPNFVKIAPLWRVLSNSSWCEPVIVHTGQHYDLNMSDWMFRDLGLPAPHHHLNAQTGSHARVTGSVMVAYEALCLEQDRPDWVVVVGDVDSTIACALTAKKLGLPVAHLEAGLRSFDRSMPEEINRVLTDSIADLLWTPSADADENLAREGIGAERIERVGNIMIDALVNLEAAVDAYDLTPDLGFALPEVYGVVTLHRPSNVDVPKILKEIVDRLCVAARQAFLVFPVHPRTARALEREGLGALLADAGVRMIPPCSYLPFMALIKKAAFLLTDSGGIQEEASYLGIPCLTLRNSTERPITLSLGTNRLIGVDDIEGAVAQALLHHRRPATIPLWDGKTAERVALSLQKAARRAP
ncbi:UDP-N-acetylglucosamine 2-epimerase [Devosia sp. H5989]|nr:UDP-N-acetylglucosamine 2-epimerase [Devosia sp. H5989]